MKFLLSASRAVTVALLFFSSVFFSVTGFSQIISYTNDTLGALNSVATNATGTALTRVNGSDMPPIICGSGFSASNFSTTTTFITSLAAVEVTATPSSGYTLNVTGFTADLRRSGSGPAFARFAYSTDGGTTWTNQGSNQVPNNATCGTTVTCTWTTAFTVASPGLLKFRVYGMDASNVTGNLQILNLKINGTVTATSTGGCGTTSGLSATSVTASTAILNWTAVTGATSYNINYRVVGTTTWSSTTAISNSVAITGLTPATTYEFQVQTVCSSATSSYTASTDFTTTATSTASSDSKIKIYFNNPVNNSVSTGVNAVYLHNTMADTLIAYILRAKYTIDIAQYDYNQSSGFSSIANAINTAYANGVKVRWIYDGSQSNTGLGLLNTGIHKLGSPTSSAYGIMHNKFVIIDANSSDPNDAIVSTGSEDWGLLQLDSVNNNLLFIQDSALAHAYTNEFNMMWGDTGIAPNTSLSKFGPYKTDLGAHTFSIAGKTVELYFSPSDGTDSHIQSSINSANTDLYFGVYTFTMAGDANAIVARQTAGVYVAGITDQYSITAGAAYSILNSGLGSMLKTYTSPTLYYHNKMMVVDPSNTCSDPLVLTGSHNWTSAANTKNDENTIIIHNDTIANIYYQAIYADYTALGGTLNAIAPCTATCSTPVGVFASAITATSAVLNWTSVASAISYTIQYRPTSTSTWTTITSATSSVTITGLTPVTTYEFQVEAVCSATDSSAFSTAISFTTTDVVTTPPTAVGNNNLTADDFIVYPNPTANDVSFKYNLSASEYVRMVIYNVLGQEVSSVVSGEQQAQGTHTYSTTIAAPGVYWVKLTIGNASVTKKIIKL